ncbi:MULTISPECIES: ABC transporter ATP-binding protein [unclassified Neorhizobium]|uniref:ABC transporter ATP-binding protein n=1 Tax=unclassified Neorhizobium TaxID=2629175 RepID=UPI001FF3F17B|nr:MULTISPECIES: ABC transporter ATP-binding protein [unclassified Neorhizobium]MCJ9669773.1 ABC transporter ATP-binding protein [Neorhizobium sp. SHOUNA12B]MCJ9743208.1 ABC transporter ATP-binding protein [Neorhizobium sp. SHOUNA12A]
MSNERLSIEHLNVLLPRGADRAFAVEDLSLSVSKGEILCIVGESGSGKSLTALATMGLLPRNLGRPAGKVMFEGKDLLTLDEATRRDITGRRIAMIFQEPTAALNPIFRVGEQVSETFRIHTSLSGAEIRKKVIDLFREVQLPNPEQIYHSYPHQLSGGQCQRVMIATALALDPSVLIADEPTTALDVTTQAQILKLMLDLRAKHDTGIVFITHDFGVVAEIADRVAVMQMGKLVEIGTRDEILNHPRQDYTRRLLAAVPTLTPRKEREGLGNPVLIARNIVKTFARSGLFGGGRTVKAVDDVDITIRRGETLGLVGESGSGKSTLAQCVIRLVQPESGDILISGGDFAGLNGKALREARRKVQIVFQDPYTALDPRQKVGDSIAEGPVIHGLDRKAAMARALDLLEACGLDRASATRFPHEFSGGQRQRICIARALAVEPELLIADESVSALDVSVQAQVLKLLADMQERLGFGILFITHDLRVASQICDNIAVMRNGRIVERGDPASLFGAPKETYTKELLAAVPGKGWQRHSSENEAGTVKSREETP